MSDDISISNLEKDALKETANIGAGHASSALSEMVDMKVNLVVSDINLVMVQDIGNEIQGPQNLVVGIYTPIVRDLKGSIVIIFNAKSALSLAKVMQKQSITMIPESEVITPEDQKILKKVGSIISDSYISSLNRFLDTSMAYDQTNIVSTFGESIIDLITLAVDPEAKSALLIMTDFKVESTDIKGQFILLLGIKSLDSLLESIRRKLS